MKTPPPLFFSEPNAGQVSKHAASGIKNTLPGEQELPDAPWVTLRCGRQCIPQHFLTFQHDIGSVEAIIQQITFDERYLLFVEQRDQCIYLQVGIIGKDNYLPQHKQQGEKIVYGRRWRIEPQLPTSEIIQTAFLALCKAREHEIRERYRLRINEAWTTPFSGHQDLPLIARKFANGSDTKVSDTTNVQAAESLVQLTAESHAPLTMASEQDIRQLLSRIRYDGCELSLIEWHRCRNRNLLFIQLQPRMTTELQELQQPQELCLTLSQLNSNTIQRELFSALLRLSDQFVSERFKFAGCARFSESLDINDIADLSLQTRKVESLTQDENFWKRFQQSNYETDTSRVPSVNDTVYGQQLWAQMENFNIQSGIYPLAASNKKENNTDDTFSS